MCGIAGVFDPLKNCDRAFLEKMAASLKHRGPDGTNVWINSDRSVGLAHTRLAIIDLETGNQPIHSPDGRYTCVLNGEIYNYRSLRESLKTEGHQFQTNSDTEVLLAAFIAWGEECLSRLNGMFAFAIHDTRDKSLFLARDRTGIKPLYYFWQHHRLVFASEMKAILLDGNVSRRINMEALADLLVFSYPTTQGTFFRDIREIPPGSWMKFNRRETTRGRFWRWHRRPISMDFSEALEQTRERLIESVEDHFVSDVPVGSFLSGGIDSALICAIATQELGKNLDTFTVGFNVESYDESKIAGLISKHLGTRHHMIRLDRTVVNLDLLETVLGQYDQPFGDSSAIPTYLLSAEIAKHVKVVLSGDGGDEMFGGYPRFFHADLTRGLAQIFGPLLYLGYPVTRGLQMVRPDLARASRRMLNASLQRGTDRLSWFATYCPASELDSILVPEALKTLGNYSPALCPPSRAAQPGASEFMDITVERVLPGDYLRKVDVASSAHGLEVRVPFLGNQILDFSAGLEKKHKFSGRRTKILTRALLDRYLPAEFSRLPKLGFGIPLNEVLSGAEKSQLRERLVESRELGSLVNKRYVKEIALAFENDNWCVNTYSQFMAYQKFYALLALDIWLTNWRPII